MRCKNCGWPNKPGETSCAKCGSPLEADSPAANASAGGYTPYPNSDGDGLKKTVMESNVFDSGSGPVSNGPARPIPTVEEKTCPKCGYPLRPDATKCPNCNFAVNGAEAVGHTTGSMGQDGFQRRPTRMADANPAPSEAPQPTRRINTNGPTFRGTINPYMMNYQPDPVFVLQPLQRMNERKPVEAVELEGSEVVLTRDNTEPGNPSITSHEQAVVTHADGHWYIEDRSEQKTTFVQAAKKIELHDGDIILLGNRLFEFHEQQ